MSSFQELEEQDAVRMAWNVWPNTRIGATKCIIPFSAIYSLTRALPNMPSVAYEPVGCKTCGAFLNPFVGIDYASKFWTCPFCHARNHFPPHYQAISEASLPAELFPQYSTIEYTVPRTVPNGPPAYTFVVDTCVGEQELLACRTALMQALQRMPDYALVGLVTFGTHVQVHELGFEECAKSYVFRGSKDYTPEAIAEQLGLGRGGAAPRRPGPGPPPPSAAANGGGPQGGRFLVPYGECEFQISGVLDELQEDAFAPVQEHRRSRCTAAALQVAAALMRACVPSPGPLGRIMLFVGGPCTEGSGMVVGREYAEHMRSHKDLVKDAVPHFRKAHKHYTAIAEQLVQQGHALDVFACSLDQVGFAEMKEMIERTGGMCVQTDTFLNPIFKESFRRVFATEGEEGCLGFSSSATFEVIPSRDIKVAGLLGPAARVERKTSHASDNEVGMGGTTMWKICSMDTSTTMCVFFEITSTSKEQHPQMAGMAGGDQLHLQFITRYIHPSGEMRVRVTTVARHWVDENNLNDLISGFDQEAAAVTMARLASFKMENEDEFDATRWLDRSLIRLSSRFGEYRKDDPQSFSLRPELSFYPQFMFNLRRSQFVQVFGNSPDETAYHRLLLNRVSTADAMVMIQPQLIAYSFQAAPEPALLDVCSIAPDKILFMDAFFYLVVFHGSTIIEWKKAGFQEKDDYKAFAEMLEAPMREAKDMAKRRFPVPRVVDTYQGESQARFLLARLNPSATYNSAQPMSLEVIMTDDVNLAVFSEHLRKLAVQS
eukprot:evm.model.scf_2332.2 EVM.evm.TU.scf_2332.2   scf_2332:5133-14745(+)